eukprot:9958376-Karenia_brevis.AAC.1
MDSSQETFASAWHYDDWQSGRWSQDSHVVTPCPQLHPDDSRFDKSVRKRRIYCDGYKCYAMFTFKPVGFDGAYVHKCHEAASQENHTKATAVMHARYLDGTWNATWLCSTCWRRKCNSEGNRTYSLQDVRSWLGVQQSADKEWQRIREHTELGTRWDHDT